MEALENDETILLFQDILVILKTKKRVLLLAIYIITNQGAPVPWLFCMQWCVWHAWKKKTRDLLSGQGQNVDLL